MLGCKCYRILDIGEIKSAFGLTNAASGIETPENIGQAIDYLRQSILVTDDVQELAPIGKDEGGKGNVRSTYCRTCQDTYEKTVKQRMIKLLHPPTTLSTIIKIAFK